MTFAFVKTHQHEFPVVKIACVLGFLRRNYYRRLKAPLSKKEQADRALLPEIEQVFHDSDETYDSPRVYKELLSSPALSGMEKQNSNARNRAKSCNMVVNFVVNPAWDRNPPGLGLVPERALGGKP